MRAGTLRHRITIQKKVVTIDPNTGIASESWEDKYVDVPASFRVLTSRELMAAQQRNSEITSEFEIRSGLNIDPSDRIQFNGKNWDIESPQNDPTLMRFQKIKAYEGVNDG